MLRFVLVENLLQARQLRATPLSTRVPEIHEHNAATKIGELHVFVGDVLLEVKWREGFGFGIASLPNVLMDLRGSLAELRTVGNERRLQTIIRFWQKRGLDAVVGLLRLAVGRWRREREPQ